MTGYENYNVMAFKFCIQIFTVYLHSRTVEKGVLFISKLIGESPMDVEKIGFRSLKKLKKSFLKNKLEDENFFICKTKLTG